VPEPVTVRRAIVQAGLAPIDAQVLLAFVLRRDRAWLAAHATDVLAPADAEAFARLARRRRDGEPVAYLTGWREFWGLSLTVDPAVLIPRPETETLVECVLSKLPQGRDVRVLDLGTGTGAIALALAHERPRARIVATDTSESALSVARDNARRLAMASIEFIRGSWFDAVPAGERYDVIASNPPYVAAGDIHLGEGDVRFEPAGALVSGTDGLDALRAIIGSAPSYLPTGGWLVVEHGFDQSEAVRALFAAVGFAALESHRDLFGIPRVAAGRHD
jgi:release factor glutamine methyltransferase